MKRIVIIGAGFAGLAAAKALSHAKADVVLIDRTNHNLFQPLLYQVAATVLSPAQIASPIRGLLKNQRNTTVFLGEVNAIKKDAKFVYARSENHQDVAHSYDILVIATGVGHSYFGHDEFAEFAPGLKGLARDIHRTNVASISAARRTLQDRRRWTSGHGQPLPNSEALRLSTNYHGSVWISTGGFLSR